MKISELLDGVKEKHGLKTDGELARILDVDKRRVSDYYSGHRAPDDFACLKIAQAMGKSLAEIIAVVRAEAEKDENRKKAWSDFMKSLGGMAASFAVVFLAIPQLDKAIQLALLSPWDRVQDGHRFV